MSILDDLALVGVAVGVAAVASHTVASAGGIGGAVDTLVEKAQQAIGSTVGNAVNSVADYSVTGAALPEEILCQNIATWQQSMGNDFLARLIWGRSTSWDAFRRYAKTPVLGLGEDPGATPPPCWYNGGTASLATTQPVTPPPTGGDYVG